MKVVFLLLVGVCLALALPEKRVLIGRIVDSEALRKFVADMHAVLGSDATEKACENQCHIVILHDHLLQYGCGLLCHSLQALFHRFGYHDATTAASA